MAYMYGGTILLVNLSEGKISKEPTTSYSGDFWVAGGLISKSSTMEYHPRLARLTRRVFLSLA